MKDWIVSCIRSMILSWLVQRLHCLRQTLVAVATAINIFHDHPNSHPTAAFEDGMEHQKLHCRSPCCDFLCYVVITHLVLQLQSLRPLWSRCLLLLLQ